MYISALSRHSTAVLYAHTRLTSAGEVAVSTASLASDLLSAVRPSPGGLAFHHSLVQIPAAAFTVLRAVRHAMIATDDVLSVSEARLDVTSVLIYIVGPRKALTTHAQRQ